MPQPLLWISKDSSSEELSRSSRREEAKIRSHVQTSRQQAKQDGATSRSIRPRTSLLVGLRSHKQTTPKCGPSISLSKATSRVLLRDAPGAFATALGSTGSALDRNELRSLKYFQSCTSQEWPGWADLYFWNNVVLQLSQNSEVVLHSLVCLSALQESLRPDISQQLAQNYRRFSLTQGMQATKLATSKNMSYLEAAVSCIILFCVQTIQQPTAAFTLLRSATRLLEESPSDAGFSHDTSSNVDSLVLPLLNRFKGAACTIADTASTFRLSVQRHRGSNGFVGVSAQPHVPHHFRKAFDARNSLESVLMWGHDSLPSPDALVAAQNHFQIEFKRMCDQWAMAMNRSDLMHGDSYGSLDGKITTTVSRSLRIGMLFGRITVVCSHDPSEMTYDQYEDEFREIVTIAELLDIKARPHHNRSFGIDGGIVDILGFVGSKCRDPWIRRRAVHCLSSTGRIEGTRPAWMPGAILPVLIHLEERERDISSSASITEVDRRRIVCGYHIVEQQVVRLFIDGTQRHPLPTPEVIDLHLPDLHFRRSSEAHSDEVVPDVIMKPGYMAYLEDRESKSYFELTLDRFYFPIPRV